MQASTKCAVTGRFSQRWLAEAILRRNGNALDEGAEGYARRQTTGGSTEAYLLNWAAFIARRDGLSEAPSVWRRQAALSLLILMAVALIGGFSSALAVLGDGSRPVNVIWALGSLLGINLLMLLLWLAAFLFKTPAPSFGRLWFWLGRRFQQRTDSLEMSRVFVTLNNRAGLTRWWLGFISHSVWSMALIGALLGLLLALSLRSYAFMWETTILPPSVFVSVVESLVWLPSQLGFQAPDLDSIQQAGLLIGDEALGQPDAMRRAWASWLIGCLLVYGLLPRLVLVLLTVLRLLAGLGRLRLDLAAPGWSVLLHRLMPSSEAGGVTDPAPGQLPQSRIRREHLQFSDATVLIAFECAGDVPALDEFDWTERFTVDSREQRRQVLDFLQQALPGRLLIVCDAALSPDRGSLYWLTEAVGWGEKFAVYLVSPDDQDAAGQRIQSWRQSLLDGGLRESEVLDSIQDVRSWRSTA